MISSNLPPSSRPTPARDDGRQALEDQIQSVERMRDLVGNKAQFDPTLVRLKALLKTTNGTPFEMSAATRTAVEGYLSGGALPTDLDKEKTGWLQDFRALAGQGMHFGTPDGKDYSPPDAFAQLVRFRWHSMGNQVMIKTMQGNNIALRTVRPQDLHGLRFFLDRVKAGESFYDADTAEKFLDRYRDDPEGALTVGVDGKPHPWREAAPLKQAWLERLQEKPMGIQELEDGSVVIGGLVLGKGE